MRLGGDLTVCARLPGPYDPPVPPSSSISCPDCGLTVSDGALTRIPRTFDCQTCAEADDAALRRRFAVRAKFEAALTASLVGSTYPGDRNPAPAPIPTAPRTSPSDPAPENPLPAAQPTAHPPSISPPGRAGAPTYSTPQRQLGHPPSGNQTGTGAAIAAFVVFGLIALAVTYTDWLLAIIATIIVCGLGLGLSGAAATGHGRRRRRR